MSLERLVIDNIKRVRKAKGVSQEKLAEACNTATSYIGLMEIYRNIPKLSTIERIAKALDVDPLLFFQDKDKLPLEQLGQDVETRKKKKELLLRLEKEIDNLLRSL